MVYEKTQIPIAADGDNINRSGGGTDVAIVKRRTSLTCRVAA